MNILLDTQAFVWWGTEKAKLPLRIRDLCEAEESQLILSVASVWEMQIKIQLGKLRLDDPLETIIERERQVNGLFIFPILLPHVFELKHLPNDHKDPFDRLLVAQARVERFPIVSADSVLQRYPVEILW